MKYLRPRVLTAGYRILHSETSGPELLRKLQPACKAVTQSDHGFAPKRSSWGTGGRRFKSSRSDQFFQRLGARTPANEFARTVAAGPRPRTSSNGRAHELEVNDLFTRGSVEV